MSLSIQKTKRSVVYKTVDNLEIKADIYTHAPGGIDVNTPVVLFFHGGGVTAWNRLGIPAHVVQSCLKRRWVLVSADYRLLPQATGKEVVEDAKDAYAFVREKLWEVVNNSKSPEPQIMQNIIVSGPSGGGVVTFTSAHYLNPPPLALLIYYSAPNMQYEMFKSSRISIFGVGPSTTPLPESEISQFLAEPVTTGSMHAHHCFDLEMLNDDLNENKSWVRPEDDTGGSLGRLLLYQWLVQTNAYPGLMGMVDKNLDDESWKNYPKTVLVHGNKDVDAPYQGSLDAVRIIGPHPAQLFTAEGRAHIFDIPLFLGDPGLKEVEEAWAAVEKIVKEDSKTSH